MFKWLFTTGHTKMDAFRQADSGAIATVADSCNLEISYEHGQYVVHEYASNNWVASCDDIVTLRAFIYGYGSGQDSVKRSINHEVQ